MCALPAINGASRANEVETDPEATRADGLETLLGPEPEPWGMVDAERLQQRDEQVRTLANLRELALHAYAEGETDIRNIAAVLGVAETVVRQWVAPLARSQREKLHELVTDGYKQGATVRELAAQTGLSVPYIYFILRKHGVRPAVERRPMTPEDERLIVALYLAGFKIQAIVHWTGRGVTSVYGVLKRRGVPLRRSVPALSLDVRELG